jgi:hypothetical protein
MLELQQSVNQGLLNSSEANMIRNMIDLISLNDTNNLVKICGVRDELQSDLKSSPFALEIANIGCDSFSIAAVICGLAGGNLGAKIGGAVGTSSAPATGASIETGTIVGAAIGMIVGASIASIAASGD